MFTKVLKGLAIGGALLGMVASANAAEYNLNIYGASAQHKFWLNLAPDFLMSTDGGNCASVDQESYDKKHGIARGNNCLGGSDTIYIRYSSRASYDGVDAVATGTQREMVDETSCPATWGGPKNNGCTDLALTDVNLGASDVAWDAFDQQTSGYEDGTANFPNDPYSAGPFDLPEPSDVFNPIVVPFAFFANDSVCKFRCVKPYVYSDADGNDVQGPISVAAYDPMGGHKAYSHDMWECDPTKTNDDGTNPQCVGYFKCIDSVCEGGPKAASENSSCETASDCPDVDNREYICSVDGWTNMTQADCTTAGGTWSANPDYLVNTRCEAMPLDNINHAMAGQIFSGQVTDWSDFGPYFCPGPVAAMMRHAGSGTHATVTDLLKPYLLQQNTVAGIIGSSPTIWHFTSSSDLMGAVADFQGAVGYADADKLIDFKGVADGAFDKSATPIDDPDGIAGAHLMKYNGVEPTRQKIVNCEYEFWAAQHVYYERARDFTNATLEGLLDDLIAFSTQSGNLTADTLGNAAEFWSAQDELNCKKTITSVTKARIDQK